jgi:hypothetical protein
MVFGQHFHCTPSRTVRTGQIDCPINHATNTAMWIWLENGAINSLMMRMQRRTFANGSTEATNQRASTTAVKVCVELK